MINQMQHTRERATEGESHTNCKLDVFNTSCRGRGIKVNALLRKGNTVLSCEPYVAVSISEIHGKMCDKCLTVKDDLLKCSCCKLIYYCGKPCQVKAWKMHKLECNYLKTVSTKIPADTVRLLALLYLKNNSKYNEDWVKDLRSHCENLRGEKSEIFALILTRLQSFFNLIPGINDEEIFQQFCKINCNTFTICNGEMKPVGLGLYPTASFINHSCDPNCVAVFTGLTCHIQSIQDIQAGEELCISYTELLRPSYIRQDELKKQYFFECFCVACEQEGMSGTAMNGLKCANKNCTNPVGFHSENNICGSCGTKVLHIYNSTFIKDLYQTIEVKLSSIEALLKQQDQDGNKKSLSICEHLLNDAARILYPLNYQILKIVDKASDLCIEMGLWNKALHYCKMAMLGYQQFYPKYHPSIGLQLYRIGKLELYLDMFDAGFSSLSQAKDVLDICYSKKHPFTIQLEHLLFQTIQEKQILSTA